MPSIRDQLDTQLRRFEDLERQMNDPAVQTDGVKFSAVAREHGSLAKVATRYRRFKSVVDEVAELKQMSEAGSPEEKELAESELPDLVLMDIALGEMDGWEATKLIKANPRTATIPVIALTAHALASDRATSVRVGCAEYDTKPVDMPRLLEKIRRCLGPPPSVDAA